MQTVMKKAFTLVEILMVMAIMGIVVMLLVTIFKPIVQKKEAYYANGAFSSIVSIVNNLVAENEPNGLLYSGDGSTANSKKTKNFCNKFFDEAATSGANNCATTTSNATNVVLSNGVAVKNISRGWLNFLTPRKNGRTGSYLNALIDIDGDDDTTDDRYTLRIYKHNGIVAPDDIYLVGTDTAKTFKFYVTSKTKGILKSTSKGIDFATASCITGLSEDLYAGDPISPCTKNTSFCPNYYDCEIHLLKTPHFTNIFGVGMTN